MFKLSKNHTNYISLQDEETFGWFGNSNFIIGQIYQIYYTYKIKHTRDFSYFLQSLWIIGNCMFFIFGILDNSLSMYVGNLITLICSIIQLSQKIYYDNYYVRSVSGYVEIN
jgi:uncharacterized protein with PQ loop repeat